VISLGGSGSLAVVRWTGSDLDQRLGEATTLRIRICDADLYSFWSQ
jgi:hypothetical protein